MPKEAFELRRVREHLTAIGRYLEQGAQIARGVPPGQIAKLKLEDIPRAPGPRLTGVTWSASGTRVIQSPKETEVVLVEGHNLADAESFTLVKSGHGEPHVTVKAQRLQSVSQTGFSADIVLKGLSPGDFDGLVRNGTGQEFLLLNACSIDAPAAAPAEPGLQLGGIFPNIAVVTEPAKGTLFYAFLVVLRGQPTDFSVTNDKDEKQKGWNVKPIELHTFMTGSGWTLARCTAHTEHMQQVHQGAHVLLLEIKIPSSISPDQDVFCLVAKSTSPASQDKLVFIVQSVGK